MNVRSIPGTGLSHPPARSPAPERVDDTFRALADTAPLLIWMSGRDKLYTWFNRAWLQFTGRRLEEQIGSGWTSGIHVDDLERCLDLYMRAFDARREFRIEYRLRRADGVYRWMLDTGSPRSGPDGAFAGYIGACVDIDAQRQVEGSLRESEERYRVVTETVADALITLDAEGRIRLVNSGAERLFGYTAGELLGRPIGFLVPDDFRLAEALAPRPGATTLGSTPWRDVQCAGRHRSGDTIPLEVSVGISRLNGEPLYTAVVRDVTARQRVERLKDEIVVAASHELKTPLTSIHGALRLIAGGAAGPVPSRMKELIDVAEASSGHLTRLVHDILDLGTLESSEADLTTAVYDARMVIDESAAAHRALAEERAVRIVVALPANRASVRLDRDKLMHVLGHLLTSACRLAPRGSTVEVAVTRRAGNVRITVRDQGPGIVRQIGGSGLGLSITKAVVERMRGRIDFRCDEGGGTTVSIDFPEWRRNDPVPAVPAGR